MPNQSPGAKLVFPQNWTTPVLWPTTSTLSPRRTSGPSHTELLAEGVRLRRPPGVSEVVQGEERRAGEGVVLGLRETRSRRCLAGRRCLGSGRGRAPGPCRESSEEDEEERERERTPVLILEVMRDRSMRRGGRMGVDVFVLLVLCLSKGLLILERGAKIPCLIRQVKY